MKLNINKYLYENYCSIELTPAADDIIFAYDLHSSLTLIFFSSGSYSLILSSSGSTTCVYYPSNVFPLVKNHFPFPFGWLFSNYP